MVNVILSLALVFLVSATSLAQESCLSKLRGRVVPNSAITIIKKDAAILKARFLRVNTETDMLTVLPISNTAQEVTLDLGEISQVDYRAPGKLKPLVMLGGFLFGMAGGAALFSTATTSGPYSGLIVLAGAGFFGLVGLTWGTIVSLSMDSTHHLKCE
ncbi:MAG: hypothetical protein L0Y74_00140 [candidate division Zixibacteria bacterium]|nr:hypothetical protein [candidate division Zixibacteria bacterium]